MWHMTVVSDVNDVADRAVTSGLTDFRNRARSNC